MASKLASVIKNWTMRQYAYTPNGYNHKGQWKDIKTGDTVEYAVQESAHQYRVDSISEDGKTATISLVSATATDTMPSTYPAPIQMLRLVQNNA